MLNELSARILTWATRVREESGQGLAEYALILVLVSIVSIGVLRFLGVDVMDVFTQVETALDGTAGG